MTLSPADIRSARRRGHLVLISGQALAGLGMGATFSAGALLVTQVSGSDALSGMAATGTTVGAAVAAIPLAALARRAGRAPSLATGALVAAAGAGVGLLASVLGSLPLLLVGLVMLGFGTAVNLQSRFAATDLSEPGSRGRDLAFVVWATTVGAVLGPNLISPADAFGRSLGVPSLTGPFLFTIAAQLVAAAIYFIFLRPDPLELAARIGRERDAGVAALVDIPTADRSGVRTGLIALALSHATMVSIMSMTPVHLVEHGATLVIVGLTISLHVAGMFALSPVFGWLSDRVGRDAVIALGQGLLLAALLFVSIGGEYQGAVMAGLILLGLGWSASTVSASSLVADSADPLRRTVIQGRADLLMSASGAVGGALAGPALAALTYEGLALVTIGLVVVVLIAVAYRTARRTRRVA
ncbi:MAG TPA: MFS transporter [Pseudolysinimonas sp.]|nr:MFS transporter [Pseudolysinimonas sp.]